MRYLRLVGSVLSQARNRRLKLTRLGLAELLSFWHVEYDVYLHAPWGSRTRFQDTLRPVRGVIDAVMSEVGNGRVGFDVKGSPFGNLPDTESYYSIGYPNFPLAGYCDGYI